MHDFNFIMPALESFGGWGYWVVFLIAFSESFAFVGNLVPGSILIYLAGFAASRGYLNIVTLVWFTVAGAILGDGSSYFLGTKGKRFFREENKFLKLSHLEKGEEFFRKHGSKSVFLGRFIGPLRPIIPFIAGLSRMGKRVFFPWDISSAIIWSLAHLYTGYFFGGAVSLIETWTTRAGMIMAFSALALAIVWLLLKKSRPFFAFLKLFLTSVRERIRSSSFVRKLASEYPVQTAFVKERFSVEKFSGLPLSMVLLGFVYVLFLFYGSVQSILSSPSVALFDKRVADLMFSFRDKELVALFTWIALLAKWQVLAIFAIAATLMMRIWKKEFYIPALWATIAAGEFLNYLGGLAFYRPRLETAVYFGTLSSFPNGYSAAAMAFYGFIVYVLARHSKNWGRKTNILSAGITVISGVGFSVLYLGEGFWSDVWGGYLLGTLCLLMGISFAELLRTQEKNKTTVASHENAKPMTWVLLAASIALYAGFALQYHPPLNPVAAEASPATVGNAMDIFNSDLPAGASGPAQAGKMPATTEKLLGDTGQPLNFVIVAKNDADLADSLGKAGWIAADAANAVNLTKLLKAEVFGGNYPRSPMTPSFWNAAVNDFGFEKATPEKNIYSRYHLRVWETPFKTADGEIYVATARLDSVKWVFVHQSDPDIDAVRELLFSDLTKAGDIASSKKLQFVNPVPPNGDLSEHPFFTDGKIYEIVLK